MTTKAIDFEVRLARLAGLAKDVQGQFSPVYQRTLDDLEKAVAAGQIERQVALAFTIRLQHLLAARVAWVGMQINTTLTPTVLRVH